MIVRGLTDTLPDLKGERRNDMKKAAKIRLIILSSVLGLILLLFAALGLLYLYSDSVVFGHRDTSFVTAHVDIDISAADYHVNYPWFGNPMMMSGSDSYIMYAPFLGSGGEKNIWVYMAVNDPIFSWIYYLGDRYDGRFTVDYTMEQDSKSISVRLTGTAYDDDGSAVPLDQGFLFNIENASPENLPTWLNEDDLTDECKEYLDFWCNYETVPVPAWLEEKLAAQ